MSKQTDTRKQNVEQQTQDNVKKELRKHIERHQREVDYGQSDTLDPDEYASLVQTHLNQEMSVAYSEVKDARSEQDKQEKAEGAEDYVSQSDKERIGADLIETLNHLDEEKRSKVFDASRESPYWLGESSNMSMAYVESQDMLVAQTPHATITVRSTTDEDGTELSYDEAMKPDGEFRVGFKVRRETGMEFKDRKETAQDLSQKVRIDAIEDEKTLEDKLKEHIYHHGREQANFTLQQLFGDHPNLDSESEEFPSRKGYESDREYLKKLEEEVEEAEEAIMDVKQQTREFKRLINKEFQDDSNVRVKYNPSRVSETGKLEVDFRDGGSIVIESDMTAQSKFEVEGNPNSWTIRDNNRVGGIDQLEDDKIFEDDLSSLQVKGKIKGNDRRDLQDYREKSTWRNDHVRGDVAREAKERVEFSEKPKAIVRDILDREGRPAARMAVEEIDQWLVKEEGVDILGNEAEYKDDGTIERDSVADRSQKNVVNVFMNEIEPGRKTTIDGVEYARANNAEHHTFEINGRDITLSVASGHDLHNQDGEHYEFHFFDDDVEAPEDVGLTDEQVQEILNIPDEKIEELLSLDISTLSEDHPAWDMATGRYQDDDEAVQDFIDAIKEQAEDYEHEAIRRRIPFTSRRRDISDIEIKDITEEGLTAFALYKPKLTLDIMDREAIKEKSELSDSDLSNENADEITQMARILDDENDERLTEKHIQAHISNNKQDIFLSIKDHLE